MKAKRKVCINSNEIQAIIRYNSEQVAEMNFRPEIQIPDPIFEVCIFNFRIHNIQDWYVEASKDRDIICNAMYAGLIRFEYCPVLESQLETYFST